MLQAFTDSNLSSLRFSEDLLRQSDQESLHTLASVRARFTGSGVEVSESLTPFLERVVCDVCESSAVERGGVSAWVLPDSSLNATCIVTKGSTCAISITSALVNLLDDLELKFVIGHELGHFVLGHTGLPGEGSESLYLKRASEISSDRIGLVSCGSVEAAIKAMMKTASGLDESHLRFDVSSFVRSAAALEGMSALTERSSHPSLVVRARALLWLDSYVRDAGHRSLENIVELVDGMVVRDLGLYVDGSFRRSRTALVRELSKWKLAQLLHQEFGQSNAVYESLSSIAGEVTSQELREFLTDSDQEGLESDLQNRVSVLEGDLAREHPLHSDELRDHAYTNAYDIFEQVLAA